MYSKIFNKFLSKTSKTMFFNKESFLQPHGNFEKYLSINNQSIFKIIWIFGYLLVISYNPLKDSCQLALKCLRPDLHLNIFLKEMANRDSKNGRVFL